LALACGRTASDPITWRDQRGLQSPSLEDARLIQVPGSPLRIAVWENQYGKGRLSAYAIQNGDKSWSQARMTNYQLRTRGQGWDPKRDALIAPPALEGADGDVHWVQFYTPVLSAYRQHLTSLGARLHHYFPHHALLVRMTPEVRAQVAAQPYVRWVGTFPASQRLDSTLLPGLLAAGDDSPRRYNIQTLDREVFTRAEVAAGLVALGGQVHWQTINSFLLQATLTRSQLARALRISSILHVDLYSEPQEDMDVVREVGGANYVETVAGFRGEGVRAEVMDGDVLATHPDLLSRPVIIHEAGNGGASHGTPTTGIVFGDGFANGQARGMLPAAQPIFAGYTRFLPGGDGARREHTAELLQPPYEAVFQSNSWGAVQTTEYNNLSTEMDQLLFELDFLVFQSQSNTGSRSSRPQAWAKNIVSVGGIQHRNTASSADDRWGHGASIGPASDGRIKPDLAHFYDQILSPSSSGGYGSFGGTSGATPIVAGHGGIFFQMWHAGIFGNTPGSSVFASRPHMSTSKAMLINSATQWDFDGAGHDLARVHQGWGRPDLRTLYEDRSRFFIVDESDVLAPQGERRYPLIVVVGQPELKATLVYSDPGAIPAAGDHRVNDLSLELISPTGTVYYGNHGLLDGLWSAPGGSPNTVDTVENVYVKDPEAGTWTVVVRADEINQDGHTETPEIDADYALVVRPTGPVAENRR
jgi:hypothetical protein